MRISPKGRGTPQGGVISPLLANIYLHWFETIVSMTAKSVGQVMSIMRYADDFVILAREWVDGSYRRSKEFHEVNGYALRRRYPPRMYSFEGSPQGRARFLNRKSQRRCRLKFADSYYGKLNHYGMYWLKWLMFANEPC